MIVKPIIFLSPSPGAGVTTIAVNLAIGLTRLGYNVKLISSCDLMAPWLESIGENNKTLLDRNPGLIWQKDSQPIFGSSVDYIFYLARTKEKAYKFLENHYARVMCVIDGTKIELDEIVSIDQSLKRLTKDAHGLDLLILNKNKPGEWKRSSSLLLELAETFGVEKIADSIPFCEAIHDLPKENKSVWELPKQYSNRQAAFLSLVHRIMELS